MSFRTVTKPHMKKTVVTTVRARPVFRGAVSVAVLVMGRFMGSRASITDFAGQSPYSQRSATIGSTFIADLAGIQHARIPTAINTSEIVTKVVGSVGVTRT